jgi:hypothetical protein
LGRTLSASLYSVDMINTAPGVRTRAVRPYAVCGPGTTNRVYSTYRNCCRAPTETASPNRKAVTGTEMSSMNRNHTSCAPPYTAAQCSMSRGRTVAAGWAAQRSTSFSTNATSGPQGAFATVSVKVRLRGVDMLRVATDQLLGTANGWHGLTAELASAPPSAGPRLSCQTSAAAVNVVHASAAAAGEAFAARTRITAVKTAAASIAYLSTEADSVDILNAIMESL